MGRANSISEVEVLRFFEQGPIEKAEVVFNMVAEKMRERLGARGGEARAPAKDAVTARKRRPQAAGGAPGEQPVPPDAPPT